MASVEFLSDALDRFDRWALSADRGNDGWERDFPEYFLLVDAAAQILYVIDQTQSSQRAFGLIARVVSISEECEDFAERIDAERAGLHALAGIAAAGDSDCRWQIYALVIPRLGEVCLPTLRRALWDPHPYVVRRVYFAWRKNFPNVPIVLNGWELDADEKVRSHLAATND